MPARTWRGRVRKALPVRPDSLRAASFGCLGRCTCCFLSSRRSREVWNALALRLLPRAAMQTHHYAGMATHTHHQGDLLQMDGGGGQGRSDAAKGIIHRDRERLMGHGHFLASLPGAGAAAAAFAP